MKRVLLLGAGLVSQPLVRYLLDLGTIQLTIATRTVSKAHALLAGHPGGVAVALNVSEEPGRLEQLIADHDLSISLLPYTLHMRVAELCLKHRKHMVTTSYVSAAMRELDARVGEAGLLFLNEVGVDPGLDHMSAMQIIDTVKARGGSVTAFYSFCGGLPAPAANNNPLGYKFSWSPRGVVLAGRNSARFRYEGEVREIPGPELFASYRRSEVAGLGTFEVYPNRDSTPYAALYGLEETRTLIRGTYRNLGWCSSFKKFADLGLLSDVPRPELEGRSHREFMASLLSSEPGVEESVEVATARQLGLGIDDPIMLRMRWLELFSEDPIEAEALAPLDIFCARMQRKMGYAEGEVDMIVMQHEFFVEYADETPDERIISTLVDYGVPDGASSMARTVALPAAIATRLILEDAFSVRGVQIPNIPEIYEPIMAELGELGIAFTEESRTIDEML